jgi:hypothetical protein
MERARPGLRACGNLGLLAELTGPDGRVLGLDVNPDHVRLAGEFAARELGNVTVKAADARATGLPGSSFDLVRSLRPKILERELLTERQLDELDRAARAHIEDPRTVMLPMLYFTAWGRKPG